MKQLRSYITIKRGKSTIKATDETIHKIVKDELDRLGHNADLNHIDVSEVTTMYNLFNCVHSLYISDRLGPDYVDLNPDISGWDVSNVTNMDSMFKFCSKFNCDISKWDVSNVTNMYCMFYGCKKFNQDIGGWKVDNVEERRYMFSDCNEFFQDLSKWNMPKASPIYVSDMFYECPIKNKEEYLPNTRYKKMKHLNQYIILRK